MEVWGRNPVRDLNVFIFLRKKTFFFFYFSYLKLIRINFCNIPLSIYETDYITFLRFIYLINVNQNFSTGKWFQLGNKTHYWNMVKLRCNLCWLYFYCWCHFLFLRLKIINVTDLHLIRSLLQIVFDLFNTIEIIETFFKSYFFTTI